MSLGPVGGGGRPQLTLARRNFAALCLQCCDMGEMVPENTTQIKAESWRPGVGNANCRGKFLGVFQSGTHSPTKLDGGRPRPGEGKADKGGFRVIPSREGSLPCHFLLLVIERGKGKGHDASRIPAGKK